jgi:glutathione S-transferase
VTEERLVIHGSPASQPSRAVYWTCLMRGLPFELRPPGPPGSAGGSDGDALAKRNPRRQMPTVVRGDFALYEMPAILTWLSNTHGWHDLYPREPDARALVDQYLHFHHSTTRLATLKLMAPHVTIAFGGIPATTKDVILRETTGLAMAADDVYGHGRAVVEMVAELVEASFFRKDRDHLCSHGAPTLADIACYEELAQLRWAGLFDFEGFPKLRAWLHCMAELPFHDTVHRYNLVLGDIRSRPNTMERFLAAAVAGVSALEELGIPVSVAAPA